jgi:hypothetical protein
VCRTSWAQRGDTVAEVNDISCDLQVQKERDALQNKQETLSVPSKRRSSKKRRKTVEACPPAPRNTTAFLIAEHNVYVT